MILWWPDQSNKSKYLSSSSKCWVDFEVEYAESHKWDDPSDDQLCQVVVEEHIVQVHAKISWYNTHHSVIDPFSRIRQKIIPKNHQAMFSSYRRITQSKPIFIYLHRKWFIWRSFQILKMISNERYRNENHHEQLHSCFLTHKKKYFHKKCLNLFLKVVFYSKNSYLC